MNLENINKEDIQKGNLLIVDDDLSYIKILEKYFQNLYNIMSCQSAEEGLEILKKGYKPLVIFSDQRMPTMTGDEFLEKTIDYVPDAARIILTGFSSPNDIINCINKGHIFMYITKPGNEHELIQATRLGIEYYNSNIKNKELLYKLENAVSELEEKNEKLKKLVSEKNTVLTQTVQALAGLFSMSERFYFTNHSHNVAVISKAIAQELGFPADKINFIVLTSLLHNVVTIGMPLNMQLLDPVEIDEFQQIKYRHYFDNAIRNLAKIKFLADHANIISEIWEHQDGTGFPLNLIGTKIDIESQIIALANIYHNKVYRLQQEHLSMLEHNGEITQNSDETKKRHAEAIKYFYRKSNWFNIDASNAFHEVIRKKNCPSLVPDNKILLLKYIEKDVKITRKSETEEQTITGDGDITKQKQGKPIEKVIQIADLEAGMVVAQSIVSTTGILIMRQDTTIDNSGLKNIQQMDRSGLLRNKTVTIISKKDDN
jgi:response regulator RpfG family c-di-GMP phosphodiesterase